MFALQETFINDTIISADCKYIGLNWGCNKIKSRLRWDTVNIFEDKLRTRGPIKILKFRPVKISTVDLISEAKCSIQKWRLHGLVA